MNTRLAISAFDHESATWACVDALADLWMDSPGDFLEIAELLQAAHLAPTNEAKREACNRLGAALFNRTVEIVEWKAEQMAGVE